jgi:hypothetical protein
MITAIKWPLAIPDIWCRRINMLCIFYWRCCVCWNVVLSWKGPCNEHDDPVGCDTSKCYRKLQTFCGILKIPFFLFYPDVRLVFFPKCWQILAHCLALSLRRQFCHWTLKSCEVNSQVKLGHNLMTLRNWPIFSLHLVLSAGDTRGVLC